MKRSAQWLVALGLACSKAPPAASPTEGQAGASPPAAPVEGSAAQEVPRTPSSPTPGPGAPDPADPGASASPTPAAAPPSEPGSGEAAPTEPGTAQPGALEPAAEAAPTPEQQTLETVFRARACHLRRSEREGLKALDARYGFKDSADFSARFAKAAETSPRWAERVMAEALVAPCPVPEPVAPP